MGTGRSSHARWGPQSSTSDPGNAAGEEYSNHRVLS